MTADLRERFELVAEFAGKLRAEGVMSLDIDGIRVVLAPPTEPQPAVASPDVLAAEADRFAREAEEADEAAAYGLPPGSKLPGFTRPPDLQRKADT